MTPTYLITLLIQVLHINILIFLLLLLLRNINYNHNNISDNLLWYINVQFNKVNNHSTSLKSFKYLQWNYVGTPIYYKLSYIIP